MLLVDPSTKTYAPCDPGNSFICADTPDAVFVDPGIPPTATDDAASTPQDTPVVIAALANDDTVVGAPLTGLQVTEQPSHGTVTLPQEQAGVRRAATAPTGPPFTYTPAKGFAGVDHFSYRISDANGSATAVVTITVVAAPSSTPASSTPAPATSSATEPLANTGSDDSTLLGIGALLLVTGGVATAAGRRLRRGRHAA